MNNASVTYMLVMSLECEWCIMLQDDPLSALDYQVGQKLFDLGIRRLLLRQKRTVILVTHRLQLLAHAHQVH
jgi:ABC-type nitrate/sulfonate/bicarbonate transport system ATPase subunit